MAGIYALDAVLGLTHMFGHGEEAERNVYLAMAREAYLQDRIGVDEFERQVGRILAGHRVSIPRPGAHMVLAYQHCRACETLRGRRQLERTNDGS